MAEGDSGVGASAVGAGAGVVTGVEEAEGLETGLVEGKVEESEVEVGGEVRGGGGGGGGGVVVCVAGVLGWGFG